MVSKLLAFCSVANAVMCCVHAYAQNSRTTGPYPPANLWMTVPVSWAPGSDPVPSSVRQQRDKYFVQLIGLAVPLTPANVKSTGFSEGVSLRTNGLAPGARAVSVHVGRTYLLAISYQPMGDFFRLGKTWDLTDGVVKANFSTGPRVPSTLAGMTVQQLVVALNAQIGVR